MIKNKAKVTEGRQGFYVARRKTTGMYWAITADAYNLYAEDFEHGEFCRSIVDAARKADEYNKTPPDEFDNMVMINSDEEEDESLAVIKLKETKITKGK